MCWGHCPARGETHLEEPRPNQPDVTCKLTAFHQVPRGDITGPVGTSRPAHGDCSWGSRPQAQACPEYRTPSFFLLYVGCDSQPAPPADWGVNVFPLWGPPLIILRTEVEERPASPPPTGDPKGTQCHSMNGCTLGALGVSAGVGPQHPRGVQSQPAGPAPPLATHPFAFSRVLRFQVTGDPVSGFG